MKIGVEQVPRISQLRKFVKLTTEFQLKMVSNENKSSFEFMGALECFNCFFYIEEQSTNHNGIEK